MTWRDDYLQASFRGVPFYVSEVELGGGRRTVKHEYVLRDIPYMEDMGRKAQEFTLSAYVLGENYTAARDALLGVCEAAGPGQLVHPYRGTITVVCTGVSVREEVQEGGMARFTMTFIEAGEQQFPSALIDRAFTLDAAASSLIQAAGADAIVRMVVDKVPEFVRAAASGEVKKLATMLLDLTFPGVAGTALATYERLAGLLNTDADEMVADPAGTVDRVIEAVQAVRGLAANGDQASTNLTTMRNFTELSEPGITAMRAAADGNRKAIGDLIRRAAAAEQARATIARTFTTYEDAIAAREDMANFLDTLATTASDEVYVALQALRAEVVAAVPGEDQDLPRIVRLALSNTRPSLALAYDLYEDPLRESEIVARNAVRHPGFLPAGRQLEVLTDE
jgi:prophage DNA circulation protein